MPDVMHLTDRRGRVWTMMTRAMLLATAAVWLGGCTPTVRVPADQRLSAYDDGAYRAVLAAVVRDGRVDYHRLRHEMTGPLDVYLDGVARFGPRSTPQQFPTPQHVLAYRVNAFNALTLKTWLHRGGDDLATRLLKPSWFVFDNWVIDGSRQDLHEFEFKVIRREHEDWRLGFALVRGTIDNPPLLEEPYDPGRLDQQLDTQVRRWMSDPQVLRIDDGVVRMPAIFKDWRRHLEPIGGLAGLFERYLEPSDERRSPAIRAAIGDQIQFDPPNRAINAVPR
jgi:hypothetical protein